MNTAEIYQVSSQFQILSVLAMLSSNATNDPSTQRVLLLCNNAAIPETSANLAHSEIGVFAGQYFDEILDYNEVVYPLKPNDFTPHDDHAPVFQSLLRKALGIPRDSHITLYLESLQSQLAKSLAAIFWDAEIVAHADGLMVFGPSREVIPETVSSRLTALAYPDLIPQLTPRLLAEFDPQLLPISATDFRAVVREFAQWLRDNYEPATPQEPYVLVLGQYFSDLGILSAEEDLSLSISLIRAASETEDTTVVFKPHPSASRSSMMTLTERAASEGLSVVIAQAPLPVEVLFELDPPQQVVSVFSTGLATAAFFYSIPVRAVGTELLLERLTPYQNSNRIPATICDSLWSVSPDVELPLLVDAVSYCMQSKLVPQLRQSALQLVSHESNTTQPPTWRRYIKRRRAEALGLVAPPPKKIKDEALREKREAPQPIVPGRPSILSRIFGGFSKEDPRQTA